jgi:hypothetical protein
MAIFYNAGETKKRPGVYQRHTNAGGAISASAQNGICAIPVQANWGPLGKVLRNGSSADLTRNYGAGTYGAGYTVPAAAAMFAGGASIVYTYRMGTGGKAATLTVGETVTVTAKHVGTLPISVSVQEKLGDATKKLLHVYVGTALVETFTFAADGKAEGANLVAATADSLYVSITGTAATVPAVAVASGALTGGENPTVTNEDYSTAFAALEAYYYNTIALDVDDDENMTLSLLLQEYLNNAYKYGKLAIAVYGQKTSVEFATRAQHAKAFNDAKGVFLGGGYMAGTENKDGVLAICYTAGVIAATPSNQGIVHAVITGATELCESLTYEQYEDAIGAGMLMLSTSPDGQIWYDSGITTLVTPADDQDDGWKKIRRVKTRFEIIDRLDRVLTPKVGRVSADSDGIADVVQAGQRILDMMVSEGKLMTGASFTEDLDNPFAGDSAWFVIKADDIDSLEKIYLQYQFRYNQQA